MRHRLPKLQDILPAYAIIVAILFGWSLVTFMWKVPSWLLYLNVGEMMTILAYTLATDFLESVFWLGCILLITFVLPAGLLADHFVERGSSMSLIILGSAALFVNRYATVGSGVVRYALLWLLVTLLLAILVVYLEARVQKVGAMISWFADRLTVFLYFLVPAGIISLVIVLVRNIFL